MYSLSITRCLFVLSLFISISLTVQGQSYKNQVGFMLDNDQYVLYKDFDRYYTAGFFLYYRHVLPQENLPERIQKKILDIEIGQKIYTPYSGNVYQLNLQDRPFTAYLYGGAKMKWFYKSEDLITASAQMGIMGPSAKGKEVQSGFHELLKLYQIRGWEYQLRDEVALNLELKYQHLLYRPNKTIFDLSLAGETALGNTFSGAGMGLIMRLGSINPFYHSSFNNSRLGNDGMQGKSKTEFFIFTKPQINYVAYNATIQGGMFIQDKGPLTFGIKHWVYSQQIGLNYATNRYSAKFIFHIKSKEVESVAQPYQYGSIAFAYSL